MYHFEKNDIIQRKLGSVLAAIEYEYHLKILDAEARFAEGKIDENQFKKQLRKLS